jgi:uncharacterized protein (DUF58 family)
VSPLVVTPVVLRRFWYRRFRAMTSFQQRWKRRFSPAGFLLLAALGGSAVVGLDTSRTVAYQIFTLLLAVLVVSIAGSVRFRASLTVRRSLPTYVTAGDTVTYRLFVGTTGPATERGLVAMEDLADPRPTFQEFLRGREPGEERRNAFDRAVGWYRWTWLLARNERAVVPTRLLPPVSPRRETEVRMDLVARRRGFVRFTGVTIARRDPLGLSNALLSLPLPDTVLVLPRRYPVPRVPLPGTRRYQPGGVTLASSVGESDEFVSLRDYRPGDARRRIHWRSFARVGHPVVREHQDEFFVRHALLLDTFTEHPDERFEEAVSVAASLACSLETHDSLLDLMFIGPQAYTFTAGRGLGTTARMLEILACVEPCQGQTFASLHRAVLAREGALSGSLCVLLGWDAARRDLVRDLRALGLPTRVFVVTADASGEPPSGEQVHRLVVGRIAEDLARL